MRPSLATTTAIGLLALSGAARATTAYPPCSRTPTSADVEGAKGAHRAATQFFERGEYERAVQYWKDAYQFDCTRPAILLNIANAWEKAGTTSEAVFALEAYVERAQGVDLSAVKTRLEALRATLVDTPPPPAVEEPSPQAAPPPATDALQPAQSGAPPYGLLPWITVGAGGAAVLAGAVLLPLGIAKRSAANCSDEAVEGEFSCDDPDGAQLGQTLANAGGIVLAAGAVVAVAGLVWELQFNLDEPNGTSATLQLSPESVLFSGRF